ncbi:hypothetical protein [Micromonospora lupini]|uniref:hypothetical protein n=1 Tax=Micromonospora lupini TaxID=285679 RepID=UPI0033C58244
MAEPSRAPTVVMPEPQGSGPAAAIGWRQEFVRAYVEHAGDRPASERLTVRWPTLVTVSALVCVGALVVGIFWSLVRPLPDKPPAQAAPPNGVLAPGAPTTWSTVAGWDCVAAPDHGFEAAGRTAEWRTVGTGGWNGDNCHGTYATVPPPATKQTKAGAESVTWWFAPPKGMNTCAVSVYVPEGDYHPANRARYAMTPGRGGTPYANFTFDQKAHAGTWAPAGTFPVHQNKIAIALDLSGSAGVKGSRIALAQMKVACET